MRVLVYGAGNIGCLYAGRLARAGHDVVVLARGERLEALRSGGIHLEDFDTAERTHVTVDVAGALTPHDVYDLVLVVLPREHVAEVLPILAASRVQSVMFFGNNAGGADAMVEALGPQRVLLGFPGAAAIPGEEAIRYLILSRREQPTTIGELDGTRSPRIRAIAGAFEEAGFPAAVSPNIDAWLKTHAVAILPTACALYMVDLDRERLARSRAALQLMLRAIREGYRVLRARGIPITPSQHRVFEWLPERLLRFIMRKMVSSDGAAIKIGHASAARAEMSALAGDLGRLIEGAGVPTPSLDELLRYVA